MSRLRYPWLAAALVLLALAAWLMSTDDKMNEEPGLDRVEFPASMRAREVDRAEARRRTLPPPLLPAGDPPLAEAVNADPVLRALPSGSRSTVVIEANAVRHSELGRLFVDCLRSGDHDPFAAIQEKTGFDVLEDLDRVAVTDDALLVSGHFGEARWAELFAGEEPEAYGDAGTLACPGFDCVGTWNDELIIVGRDRDTIAGAIDRIEGRAEARPPIEEHETYGEIYGTIDPEQLAGALPADQGPLAEIIRQVVGAVDLHVDAMDDVAMVAELEGEDHPRLTDLGKSLGSALAVARMAAKARGEEELAELLSHARVSTGGPIAVELALPRSLVQKHLEEVCRRQHEERRFQEQHAELAEPAPTAE